MASSISESAPKIDDLEFYDLDPSSVAMVLKQAEIDASGPSNEKFNLEEYMNVICSDLEQLDVEILPIPRYINSDFPLPDNQLRPSQTNMPVQFPSLNMTYPFESNSASILELNSGNNPVPCFPNQPQYRPRTNSCPNAYATMTNLDVPMAAGINDISNAYLMLLNNTSPLNVKEIPESSRLNYNGSDLYSSTRRFSLHSESSLLNSPPDSPDMDPPNERVPSIVNSSDKLVDGHKLENTYESNNGTRARLSSSKKKRTFTGERRLRRRRSQLSLSFVCFICNKSYQEFRSLQHHSNLGHDIKISKAMYQSFSHGLKNL